MEKEEGVEGQTLTLGALIWSFSLASLGATAALSAKSRSASYEFDILLKACKDFILCALTKREELLV